MHLRHGILSVSGNKTGTMEAKQNRLSINIQLLSRFTRTQTRGRTGMDVTPLVFETSASTDSAIWASFLIASAKVHIFFNSARNTVKKVEKKFSNTI